MNIRMARLNVFVSGGKWGKTKINKKMAIVYI